MLKKSFIMLIALLMPILASAENGDTLWTKRLSGSHAAVHPNSQVIAIGGDAVYILDIETGEEIKRYEGVTVGNGLEFSKTGKYLAFANEDALRVVDFETDEIMLDKKNPLSVRAFTISPDERFVVTCIGSGMGVYDIQAGKAVNSFGHMTSPDEFSYYHPIGDVQYSPDGKYIAYSATDSLRFLNTETWEISDFKIPNNASGPVKYSPDGRYLGYLKNADEDHVVVIDLDTKEIIYKTKSYSSFFDFSPDSKYLYRDVGTEVDIIDLASNKLIYFYEDPLIDNYFQDFEISKDFQYAVGNQSRYVLVFPITWTSIQEDMGLIEGLNYSYPNPAGNTLNIEFNLLEPSNVKIELVDLNGALIKSITDGFMDAGEQHLSADISAIPSGTYILRLTIGGKTYTEKIIVSY